MADDAAVAAPEQSNEATTAAPQATDAPAQTASAESAAPEESEAPKPGATPPKAFTQEEVNKFLAREVAKQRRRIEREMRLSIENEALRRQVEGPKPEARAPDASGGKPQLKDFPDYESFVEAVADWRAEQKIEARIKAEAEKTKALTEKERDAERRAYFHERVIERGAALYEDFEDVALAEDLPITEPMLLTIAESDHGPVAAYFLGQHPEEAKRISKLSAPAQVREIDKLIATLTKPAEPTKAPEPIKPNKGDGSAGDTLETALASGDYKRFVKLRNRQLGRV